MRISLYIKSFALLFTLLVVVVSCDEFSDNSSTDYTEAPKEIAGTWRIIKVTRNGSDITTLMDFTRFRIRFNADQTYSIDNYLPFLVKSNGNWTLDDPRYPFNLILKETGSTDELISGLNYPVVNGKRQINLSFSPGCHNNIYTYVLEEVSN